MATQPRLRLPDDVIVELTRRSTDPTYDVWARYLLLLRAVNGVLDQAPTTVEQCEDFDILQRLGNDLQSLIEVIHRLFPGGLKEAWYYYLPERMRGDDNGSV